MFNVSITGMLVYKEVVGSGRKWYHYLVIFYENISDVVWKCGAVLGIVIYIFNISFANTSVRKTLLFNYFH